LWLPVLITFYLAFLRLPHWWKWWWKRYEGVEWSGLVDEDGVHIKSVSGNETLVGWQRFEEARVGADAVFLPIGRADGLAFHRKMFCDAEAWKLFLQILRSSRLKKRELDAPA
jgi:hypothetical protein